VKVEDAVIHLTDSNPGLHCMIIYEDLMTLREFYSYYIQRQIEEKKEMVLINPFYETTDSVRETLSTGYKAIDVDKYEKKEKRLVIRDSLKKYLGQKEKVVMTKDVVKVAELESYFKVEQEEELVKTNKTKKKEQNKKIKKVKGYSNWWSDNEQMIKNAQRMGNMRLSILADAGAFHFIGKTMDLLEYEYSLPKLFDLDLNINAFCIYHQKDFDRLSKEQKQKLSNHHEMTLKIEAH
jgi:hypothetical protein